MSDSSFDRLFNPGRVAVLGSVKENKIAHQVFTQMVQGGYTGDLVSVNPSAQRPSGMEDIPAYAHMSEVPEEVDLAVLAVPARFVAESLTVCGERGVPFAVVLTSGFSEIGNREGEKALKQTAGRYGMRLIGPNCAGIMSTQSHLFASIEERALPGKTALVSQSGALGAAALAMAGERGIGFSRFVSIGNRADINEADLLYYLADDEQTAQAAFYLESVMNGRKFLQAATYFAGKKPLILIKAGRSGAGMRAANSHTGSMAGSNAVFDAACVQAGILRVEGVEEMLDLCSAFEHYPVAAGKRLLIVTNSGGPGILTSDRAEAEGLELPPPSEPLKKKLAADLLPNASVNNPVDLTVEGTEEDYALAIAEGLKSEYDAAIAINVGTPFLDSTGLAEGIIRGASEVPDKPVVPVFMAGRIVKTGTELLAKKGYAPAPTGERAAAVLAAMARMQPPVMRDWALSGTSRGPAGRFLEPEQVDFLIQRGFPFPVSRFVTSAEEARTTGGGLRFPVVIKVVSQEIIHKSDAGGVMLGIRDVEELVTAYQDMASRLSNRGMRGVMIYEQVEDGREFILGAKKDPDFGPVILLGAGGVMAELIKDAVLRIAPLTEEDCEVMISSLKVAPLINGFRGSAPLAKDALVEVMLKLSSLVTAETWIEELDFNPVFLFEDRAVIGDVRVIRRKP